ncbi:MAG: type IV pili twitching motility protein PilT [Candidatus Rokuibacteriota bacterium]|nr:MAG: type IV pili twitching motility protein PilT [Candidatus Rokubacteria bacterium]
MEDGLMSMPELLQALYEKGASDLHLKVGRPPMMRRQGDLVPIEGNRVMEAADVEKLIHGVINTDQRARLEAERELDFSFSIAGLARFRANAFFQKGLPGAVLRLIPALIPTPEELGLPEVIKELSLKKQGLFLVTGPTGSGKTTTLAAIIDHINSHVPAHIITLEDPIEFVYQDKMAVINQREVGSDTRDFAQGLRRALRQDPNVILVGEMRDAETITTALSAAETGHLVFGTLHTNDAKQSVDRILDTYPPAAQNQVRMQLAKCLVAVVSQRLLKRADGQGRLAVHEIMINTPTVQKLIEDDKIAALGRAIEDSSSFYKMQSLNQALFRQVKAKTITADEALAASRNPNDLKIQLQTQGLMDSKAEAAVSLPPGSRGA